MSASQWLGFVVQHAVSEVSGAEETRRRKRPARNGRGRNTAIERLEARQLLSLTQTTTVVAPATVHNYTSIAIGPDTVEASDSGGVIDSTPTDFTYSFAGTGSTVYSSSSAPTNVGTYTVMATYPGDATHSGSTSQAGTIEIDKAQTITSVVVASPRDYNGKTVAPRFLSAGSLDDDHFADSNVADFTITYTGTGSTTYSSSTAPTNAGTYQVTATYNGDANHATSSDTEPFTISKSFTQTRIGFLTDRDYNGSPDNPFDLRVTSPDDPQFIDKNSADFTFAYTGTGSTMYSSTSAPTNTGSYQVIASYNGDANHATSSDTETFSIGLAVTQTRVGIELNNLYMASPVVPFSVSVFSPDDPGLGDSNPADFTLLYTGTGSTTYSSSSAPTDVGTYQVKATYPADANHASSSDTESFNIEKEPVNVSVFDSGGTYNGNPYPATSAAAIAFRLSDHTLTDFTFSYAGTGTTVYPASAAAPTNPGTYSVTATYPGDANHEGGSSSASPFTIGKVTPTITVADAGGQYNASAFPATAAEAKGVNGLDDSTLADFTFTYAGTSSTTYAASSTAPSNAGTYTVVATYQGDAFNAAADSSSLPFTISQATSTTSVTDAGGTYNGNSFPATAAEAKGAGGLDDTTLADFSFTYIGRGSTIYASSSAAPTDAGTYTVKASYAGDTNHLTSSGSTDFAIKQANLSVTGGTYNVVFGQAKPTLGGSINGAVPADGISATYDSGYTTTSFVANSPYAVVPTLVDPNHRLSNYAVSVTNGNIVVSAASTSVALISSTGGSSYFGQSVTFTATVSTLAPGSGVPVGSIQFFDNSVSFGAAVPLNAGVAALSIATLPIGTDLITATFVPGNTNFLTSSNSLTQSVNAGIVLLDKTGKGALSVTGTSKVNALATSIVVDSSNAAAVVVASGSVSAKLTSVSGNASVTGGGSVANLETGRAVIADPFGGLSTPVTSGLTLRSSSTLNLSATPALPLQPGLYIGGINISGSAKVTLAPGFYYLQGGGLTVGNSATLTGAGVTIYNAPAKASDQISISGAAVVTLSAATTGPWAGITIFQSKTATNTLSVANSAVLKITGAIYAASAAMSVSGSAQVQAQGSSLVLGDLSVSGSSSVTV